MFIQCPVCGKEYPTPVLICDNPVCESVKLGEPKQIMARFAAKAEKDINEAGRQAAIAIMTKHNLCN